MGYTEVVAMTTQNGLNPANMGYEELVVFATQLIARGEEDAVRIRQLENQLAAEKQHAETTISNQEATIGYLQLRLQEESQISCYDKLTGALNRHDLERKYEEVGGLNNANHYVIFIDLDKFKPTNDTYGHDVGDDLLKAI